MNHSLLKRDTQQCGSPAICTQLNGPWLADFWESQCSFLSQGSWPDPTSAGRVHEVYMIHVQVWQPGRRPKLCPTGTAISAETTARLAHISIAASSQTVKNIIPPLHIKLCPMKNFVKAMDQEGGALNFLRQKILSSTEGSP